MNPTQSSENISNDNSDNENRQSSWGSWFGSKKENNNTAPNQPQPEKQTSGWFSGWFSGGSRRRKTRIDFSKIKWGSFTKKYNSYIKRHPRKKTNIPDLKHFAEYVNKNPKQFNKKTHKRALFYKNIILRKRK
jgi:hypothetical protein